MKNKTKEELINLVEELENKVSSLQNDVEYWQEEHTELEEKIEELDSQIADMEIANGIKDVNNFKLRLEVDNLYTDKLEEFLDYYLKYYNN